MQQKAGRITAAAMTKDVAFEPADEKLNDLIDDAYRAKYKSSPYLAHMIGARARSATVRIILRDARSGRESQQCLTSL
jgi:hypothetical protein